MENKGNSFIRYSGLAFQMAIILVAGAIGGKKLDEYFNTTTPWFTFSLVIFSLFASLYMVLKGLLKK